MAANVERRPKGPRSEKDAEGSTLCPWALGWKAKEAARAKGALPSSPLFSSRDSLKEMTKASTIKA